MVNVERSGLRALYEPSFARWVLAAAVDWGVIVAAFWAAGRFVAGPWAVVAWVVASWVIGTRQHAIAILGHDGAHGLVSRNRLLNDWATRLICFAPLGVDLKGYWEFHRAHHLRNGGPDDPETLFKQLEGKWELPMSRGRLARYVLTDLIGAGGPFAIGLAVNLRPRDAAGWLALAVWWGGAIGVVAWTGCWWALALWFVSFVTSFWCVFRLRMLTEHFGTPTTHCLGASWWQRAVFLPHGTWLHDVHHANQNVPFHQLGSALRIIPPMPSERAWERSSTSCRRVNRHSRSASHSSPAGRVERETAQRRRLRTTPGVLSYRISVPCVSSVRHRRIAKSSRYGRQLIRG